MDAPCRLRQDLKDTTVSQLCDSVALILKQPLTEAKSVTLQRVTALLDTVNSTFTIPATLGGTFVASPVSHCVDLERLLSCVPDLLLRLVSGINQSHERTFRGCFSGGFSHVTCYVCVRRYPSTEGWWGRAVLVLSAATINLCVLQSSKVPEVDPS